jgi:hypothetical protein
MGSGRNRGFQAFFERLKRTRLGRKIRFMRKPKIGIPSFSSTLVTIILIAISIFIMSGGVYIQIEKTGLALQTKKGTISVVYPSTSVQTSGEAYLVASLLCLGIGGLLACLLSLRYAFRAKYGKIALFLGMGLVLLSFYILWEMTQAKLNREVWPEVMDLWRVLSPCLLS